MRKKNQSLSVRSGHAGERYIPVAMSYTSLETDCTFLSASHLVEIDGQETGVSYDMSAKDDYGFIFNPDWDYGE